MQPGSGSGKKSWRFSVNKVRDIAFAAGNKLIWHTEQLQLNGRWHRLNVAYPDNGRWLWHKYALTSTRHSLQQLTQYFGEFPFSVMNVVNIAGIGMEYPGITFVGFRGPNAAINGPAPAYSRTEKHDVLGGIMHEVAHSYFPMLVNTDERQEGFFDEGMVSFLAYLLEQSWSTDFQSFYGDPKDVGAVMNRATYAAPVRRADGSGTTFVFTNYLSKVNAEWKQTVGEGAAVKWPAGAGGKGNEGVAAFVGRLPNSIGYVEYAYAKTNKLSHVAMKNVSGEYVQPDDSAFKASAAGADWNKSFYQVLTNQPGKDAWPISGATFILMHLKQDKPEQALGSLKFFDWAYVNGDKAADELAYVPLPASVKDLVRKEWSKITDTAGKPVWTK